MQALNSATSPLERAAERLLTAVPGLDPNAVAYKPALTSVVSPIHRGVESACFSVNANQNEWFLKARYPDMTPFFDETLVSEGVKRAAKLGIGPALIYSDVTKGCYLFERLSPEWSWGKVDHFADPVILDNAVTAKKKLHESEPFSANRSVFETIDRYTNMVKTASIVVPESVTGVLRKVRQAEDAISASGLTLRPCHGDGVSSNVMISPQGDIQLVDFDLAGNADPYFDLGSMIVEIAQFPDLARAVIEIYEGQCRDEAYNRCRLYGIADDLMWSLWGFINFVQSPRKAVEFVKYAQWRLLRAVWHSSHADFDRWLSRL